MEKYHPRRKFSWKYLLLALAYGIGGVIAFASGTLILTYILNSLILFSLVLPIATLVVLYWVIKKGRLIHRWTIFLLGIILAAGIYILYHYANYIYLRNDTINFWMQHYEITHNEGVSKFNDMLLQLSGAKGFFGFLQYQPNEGILLKFWLSEGVTVPSTSPISARGIKLWLYGLMELAIVVAALLVFIRSIGARFSTECQDWYEDFSKVATLKKEYRDRFIELLERGDLISGQAMLDDTSAGCLPCLDVLLSKNPCNPEGKRILRIKEICLDKRRQVKSRLLVEFEPNFNEIQRLKLI
jgi:hypothetical protein